MLAYENKMVLWAVSPKIMLKPSPPALTSKHDTVFRDMAFTKVTKVKEVVRVGP